MKKNILWKYDYKTFHGVWNREYACQDFAFRTENKVVTFIFGHIEFHTAHKYYLNVKPDSV